jgi:hypothetical protein
MAGIGFANATHYKAYPGSFIGRQIGFFAVRHVDTNAGNGPNPVYDTENFRLALQAIQQHAEILFVGNPTVSNSWASFIVGLSVDTANDGDNLMGNTNMMAETIQDALRAVDSLNDNNDAIFERRWLFGTNLVTTGNFLTDITEGLQGGTLADAETFAPGSVEQDELINLQS